MRCCRQARVAASRFATSGATELHGNGSSSAADGGMLQQAPQEAERFGIEVGGILVQRHRQYRIDSYSSATAVCATNRSAPAAIPTMIRNSVSGKSSQVRAGTQ